jgi:hypothetical protein
MSVSEKAEAQWPKIESTYSRIQRTSRTKVLFLAGFWNRYLIEIEIRPKH